MANSPVSIFVSRQLPEFVRTDDQLFINFAEAYYEYMEQANSTLASGKVVNRAKNFLSEIDVDTTSVDGFSEKLYGEFLKYFPKDSLADRSIILKNVKDFYRARGTEKSFKFLFRAIYGKEAELYYPKNDILITSSGKWSIERSIRVENITVNGGVADSSNLSALQKFTSTLITGSSSGATAAVEKVIMSYETGVLKAELFVSDITGSFLNGEAVTTTNIDGEVLSAYILSGLLSSIYIANTGTGYTVGDPLTFTSNSGDGAAAVISAVTSGTMDSIVVGYGGAGFLVGDIVQFFGGGGSGANATVATLIGTANSHWHSNTYNVIFDTITTYANTLLGAANYSFPALQNTTPGGNTNINSAMSNAQSNSALSYFNFGITGPIGNVTIQSNGSGYTSAPTADPVGNTWVKALGILGRMKIINGGTGYANGNILTFTNTNGGAGFGANGIVANVNATGVIERLAFVPVSGLPPGGVGYVPGSLPNITITSAGGTGANVVVTALLGHGFPKTVLSVGSDTFGGILAIRIVNRGSGYNAAPTISLTSYGDGQGQAYAKIITGTYTYPGRFLDDSGFLSSYNFLQDRDYYNNYTYVVKVTETIANYNKVLKSLVHPGGMKIWGQYMFGGLTSSNVIIGGAISNVSIS